MSRQLLILGWHNVEPSWAFGGRSGAGRRGLRRQLRSLRRTANVVDLRWALNRLFSGQPLPSRAVSLTFDDGYRDNLYLAAPMLKSLGLPATFYLVPAFLHGEITAWWEALSRGVRETTAERVEFEGRCWPIGPDDDRGVVAAEIAECLKDRNWAEREAAVKELCGRLRSGAGTEQLFMDVSEARELVASGFEIGSHTMCHAILGREDLETQCRDLAEARADLEHELDAPADLLAYPNGRSGDYNEETLLAVSSARHSSAVTTEIGWNDPEVSPFELRRLSLDPNQGTRTLLRAMRDLRSHRS